MGALRLAGLAALALLPAGVSAAPDAVFDGARLSGSVPPASTVAAAPASAAALSAEDRAAVAAALDAAARAAAAWPGYDALQSPLLLIRPGGRSILIGHPNPPADFAPQTVAGRVVYVSDVPRDPGFSFKVGYDFAGAPTTVLQMTDKPGDDAALFVHERFHQHQRGWTRIALGAYGLEDPEDIALAQAEQDALARALDGGPAWREDAREFLALRALRHARAPKIAANEDWQEREEGMAYYTELAAAPGSRAAGTPLPRQLRRDLTLDEMDKGRYYATGMAQGLLLDRLGAPWKGDLEAGAAPAALLARALPPAAADEARARAASASPLYAAALARARAEIAAFVADREAALKAFEAQPGTRLLVDPGLGNGGDLYHGARLTYELPAGGGTLLSPAQPLVAEAPGWSLRLDGRRAIITEDGKVLLYAERLFVDGAPWSPARGERAFKTLTAAGPGLALDLKGGTLSFDGKTLSVSR